MVMECRITEASNREATFHGTSVEFYVLTIVRESTSDTEGLSTMAATREDIHVDLELFAKLNSEIARLFSKEDIESLAKETGWSQRTSKLASHLFLVVFVFGMNIYKIPTLEQLIGLLHICVPDLIITRQAMHDRINTYAAALFQHMLSRAIQISIPYEFDLSLLKSFSRVIILDSTAFQLPKDLADIFPGSGGSASIAGMKIQFGYDIKSSQFFYLVQEGNVPDNSDKSDYLAFLNQGDLIIADLGYFTISRLKETHHKNAYYLMRLKLNTTIYIKNDQGNYSEIDLLELSDGIANNIEEREIYLKESNVFIQIRLVLERVPAQVIEQRIRRINANDKKKGKSTSEKTKALQAFNLYISNAPISMLEGKHFRKLYCIRWQVELIFKNWKSNFGLDEFTGIREERIRCMVYAKLLMIFLLTRLSCWIRNIVWLEKKRELSEFRFTKHVIVKANEWLRLIILEPENVTKFITNIIRFAVRHCLKIKQNGRVYPLEMLEGLA